MEQYNNFSNSKNKQIIGSIAFFITALLWGLSFVFQSNTSKYMDAYSVLYLRSFIAVIFLLPFLIYSLIKDKKNEIKYKRKDIIIGPILCGISLFLASLFQQLGLETTSAGKTSFITSLYIVLVPIFSLFLKKKCHINVYISIVIAVIGLFFLSFDFSDGFYLGIGDLYVFIGAIFFAIQILLVDYYAPKINKFLLCVGQLMTQGIIALIIRTFLGICIKSFISMFNIESIVSILFIGLISSGVAYTLQVYGQALVDPTLGSLLMSLESVFSAIFSVIIYQFYKFSDIDQNMSVNEIIGAIIMFIAIILSQLPSKWFEIKKNKT